MKTFIVKRWNRKMLKYSKLLIFLMLAGSSLTGTAQPQSLMIDRIIAVVGQKPILASDLVARMEQARQGGDLQQNADCIKLEDLLYKKLLLEQARIDSVVVEEAQVNAELDRRIRYFSQQIGGDEKLEEFYGK